MRVFRFCASCKKEWSRVETGLIPDPKKWHPDTTVCFECWAGRQRGKDDRETLGKWP